MPDPNQKQRIEEAYQTVESLTGLNLKELGPEEARKLLKTFYLDRSNLYILRNMDRKSIDDSVIALSTTLKNAFDVAHSFPKPIYMVEPDDPFAVPKFIVPKQPLNFEGKPIANPTDEQKKNFEEKVAAAKRYEQQFKTKHRANLEAVSKKLEDYRMPEALKAEDYFGAADLENQEVFESLQNMDNAVGLCNLILLGREYSLRELMQNGEDVKAAKRKAGAEVAALFDGSLSPEEQSRRLEEITTKAISTLSGLSLKAVDLSDDYSLDNMTYNQWIASMADSLGQVVQDAQQTLKAGWTSKAASDVKKITNFTNGITTIDKLRLKSVAGGFKGPEEIRESALAQVLVEQVGPEYSGYRTVSIGSAKTDFNLLEELSDTMKNELGDKPEYKKAFEEYSSKGNLDSFKQLLKQDLEKKQNTLAGTVQENIRTASQNKAAAVTEEHLAWAEGIPGMTDSGLMAEMARIFGGASSTQPARWYTMQSLFIGFGCYMAEQRNEKVTIKDFLTNRELQKKTGKEAYEFFKKHNLSSEATPEFKKESERKFIEVLAALNRKLAETEVPKYDYTNPEEVKENIWYPSALKVILCDSHQLSGVISDKTKDEFYAAHGGKENYDKIFRQVAVAEMMTDALSKQIPQDVLENNSLDSIIMKHAAPFAVSALYTLKHFADKYLGKKIAELPNDEMSEVVSNFAFRTVTPIQMHVMENKDKTELKDQIREYLRTYGRKDEAGLEKKMGKINADLLEKLEEEEKKKTPIAHGEYDWSAELPPREWKKRLKMFYDELNSHDSALFKSSDEYRDVKKNLKKALDILNKPVDHHVNKKAFNESLNKIFNRAGDYIEKKKTGGIGKHYGRERLNAMKNIRGLLADRNRDTLDMTGIAGILGQKSLETDSKTGLKTIVSDKISPQEKLERGMLRLGIYLSRIEESDDKIAKGKLELLERVIAERGKNSVTREKLMDEMAKVTIPPNANTKKLVDQAKTQIISRIGSQNGLDRQAAGWCKVLKAFDTMRKNSTRPEIHRAAEDPEVKNYLRLGGFAEKALAVQNKILDAEETASLSKEDATAVVAASTISTFMKHADVGYHVRDVEGDEQDNTVFFNSFILNRSDDEMLAYFSKSGDVQAIQHEKTNAGLKKHVASEFAQEMIGVRGARKICADMAVREKREQQQLKKQVKAQRQAGLQ